MIVPRKHDKIELRVRNRGHSKHTSEYLFHARVFSVKEIRNEYYLVTYIPIDVREGKTGQFCLNKNGVWPKYGIVGMTIVDFAKKGKRSPRFTNPEFVVL